MFTGLVETKGALVRRTSRGPDARLVIEGTLDVARSPIELGESIAVDGVCLTVAAIVHQSAPVRGVGPPAAGPQAGPVVFEADASAETLAKTTLGALALGAPVNLERAVPLGARMGGHIVSGHVDGVGRVVEKSTVGAALRVAFDAPRELARFIAPKGSICVCGVSLTVNGVEGTRFDVMLVPHTREKTSLDALAVGSPVNLEVDVLARYVARLMEAGRESADAAWMDRLARAGYV